MNDLEKYFFNNDKRLIHKWTHYFDVYERYFSRFRGTEVVILEIGVFHGGSLQMWKHYFGDRARIYGVDIDPRCKELEEENIKILIGSQSDRSFLRNLKKTIPPVDILIDDGGHRMQQQIVTFEELFDHVRDDGIYLCEDLHTSYWVTHGGGYRRNGTFIEFSKKLIDRLHGYHSEQRLLKADEFTKSAAAIHFHDSVLVIEKKKRSRPEDTKTGLPSFSEEENQEGWWRPGARKLIRLTNLFLRFFRLPGVIWR